MEMHAQAALSRAAHAHACASPRAPIEATPRDGHADASPPSPFNRNRAVST
ncbi:hypothetical protein L810_5181 [Burkholderia sp. AU4i]|nr:hypothetical protein L810_5181 [Burkholderia sp. AU4i]